MCTAINYNNLFGRTLDLECSYGESVVITPRNYKFVFLHEGRFLTHFAIIGIAHIQNGVPLYYDAMNEHGLSVAALNFPDCAKYNAYKNGMKNIASFELIPWILCQCKTVKDATALLKNTNIVSDSFDDSLPSTPLHWLISDNSGSITAEPMDTGLELQHNAVEVLTNSPPFRFHITNLANYLSVDSRPPQNNICPAASIRLYSRGLGGFGLPGDLSSASRFVRAVFVKEHTLSENKNQEKISDFFHILDTVSQPQGCVLTEGGLPVSTVYTSCGDRDTVRYYFTTYNCRRIRAVNLYSSELDSSEIIEYPIDSKEDIQYLS